MDKFNILMKEMLNNRRLTVFGVSRKRLSRLNMIIRHHQVRKIFRNKYFWYAITDKNLLIEIPTDAPNDYKIVDHLLYKDLKIANVIKDKSNRVYLIANGRIDDIKALGLPYKVDEYEVAIDITNNKEIRDEINEIVLKRYEDLHQQVIDRHPEVFELIKKFDARIYDQDIYLYGTIKCTLLSQEIILKKENNTKKVEINITSIERIEKLIKKFIIS
jgi:hypothetical protein